jgi:hypothetical protein
MLRTCAFLGVDPVRLMKNISGTPRFLKDLHLYSEMNRNPTLRAHLRDLYPILNERTSPAGAARGHYFHQDLWAARLIVRRGPSSHIDIGSRIDGFISHLLCFMPVAVIDIRPMAMNVEGLTFIQDDATQMGRFDENSIDSLSSLHAAEHFGLGRYSDAIDPEASFRFMAALERVLAPAGRLYFSVPVGRERVEFNAHRIFSVDTILRRFSSLRVVSFSLVGDDGLLRQDVDPRDVPESNFACGLFEFTK